MLGSDLTSKPDSVSTLGYHWTDHTGRPLESQVHWDATGTTLADASTQWCSSGDSVLICIIGIHWKTTGATSTMGCHWNHTGWCYHPVVFQWRSSVNLHNWTTGRPLEAHWLSPVAFQCTLASKFQAHWIATGRPLAHGKGDVRFSDNSSNKLRKKHQQNEIHNGKLIILWFESLMNKQAHVLAFCIITPHWYGSWSWHLP